MQASENLVGQSLALAEALEQVSRLASINRPVLILGARGTGKELIAQRLHYLSPRWDAPLVKVNCAALAESLLESELFGHEAGAFTGATRSRAGRFERADGGTLFLDELGSMSLRLQEKLLRLVEYGEFERLGGQQTLRVDVRVLGATHADLRAQVAAGEFRADLLDRLSFDVIHLPPLQHRREDILELAEHFAVQVCPELGWPLFPGFTETARDQLLGHDWPGNVRELKNTVERSLHRWGDPEEAVDEIVLDPFRPPWQNSREDSPDAAPATAGGTSPGEREPAEPGGDFPLDFRRAMQRAERDLLVRALEAHGHHQGRTAEALQLSYDQLRGLLRKHRLAGRRRPGR
ncbi:MAG: phage shock protein operon transcriptional activator [Haliea sp.]|nr:phage shock protein operon transcriptional activator [Haliea sp.]|tara:strand:- start:1700 stop:2746 length:1047 start_codon:yes stop_codon:yes gene_type:complete